MHSVKSTDDVMKLFPGTVADIEQGVERMMRDARLAIEEIINLKDEDRTFLNTAKKLDDLSALSNFAIGAGVTQIVEMVHPDKAIRDAAHQAFIKLQDFSVDHISNNVQLYKAFKAYALGNATKEKLNKEQQYFITETLKEFKRAGLELPAEQLEVARTLHKEIAQLALQFETNIATDASSIKVTKEELAGCDADFIASLKTEDGKIVLGVDTPTVTNVLENCTVAQTRKQLSLAYNNRAYPANEAVFKQFIAKNDELARLLGYASFADLNIDNSMVGTSQRARQFIEELAIKASPKEQQEFERLTAELPASVALSPEGKMWPWDRAFVNAQYKKKHFDFDDRVIAEYFPMEKTIEGLLHIYEQFLSLKFKQFTPAHAWHEEVKGLEIYTAADNQLLGYFLMDLHPRANKYSHACHASVVPATYDAAGKPTQLVSVVIANFPKSTATKPSLLTRNDVSTFFHEFGHGMHAVLGRTELASQSGTSVKRDFVEMPSQMLEEWLFDADILKNLSSHYKTGAQLGDDVIAKIVALKNFDSGYFIQRQAALSLVSLDMFAPGAQKDPAALAAAVFTRINKNMQFVPESHMFASFGHLTGYCAKYYGYMWSKVFALDMFYQIKQQGLLNPVMGAKYVNEVISKGGSVDPNVLLRNFLGRDPNQEAFMKDLGL